MRRTLRSGGDVQIIGHPDLLLLLPRPRPTTNTQENIKMKKTEKLPFLDIWIESDLKSNKILFQSFGAIECWALSSSEGSFDLIWRTQICLVIPITIFIDFVFV